jgi:CcmD family protein
LENAIYLLAAYTVIWAFIFGYVLVMQRRQSRLQRQLTELQEHLDKSRKAG